MCSGMGVTITLGHLPAQSRIACVRAPRCVSSLFHAASPQSQLHFGETESVSIPIVKEPATQFLVAYSVLLMGLLKTKVVYQSTTMVVHFGCFVAPHVNVVVFEVNLFL